jgi:hypothetical protein
MISEEEKRRKAAFKKRKRRPWVVTFVSLFIVLLAAAAIWQKSRDPKPAQVPSETQSDASVQPGKINSIRELENLIATLEVKCETAPTPGRVEILNQLILAGQRMIELAKTDAERRTGKKTMLHSLVVLATLKWAQKIEPGDTRERLKTVSDEFRNDSDKDMMSDVYIAGILVAGFDLMDQPTSVDRVSAFNQAISAAAEKYPSELQIARTIATILDHFQLLIEDWSALPQVIEHIRTVYQGCSDPFIQRWVQALPDRLVFHQLHLDRILLDCESNVETAFDELLASIPKMLESGLSSSGLGRLISIGSVLEGMARYSHAEQLYSLLSGWIGTTPSSDELKVLRMACENGTKRLKLIGQKFILDANDAFGKTLSPNAFTGQPTLVLFLSNQREISDAQNLLAELWGLGRQGLMVVIVCLDMDSTTASSMFTEAELTRVSLVADLQRTGLIYRQCPVEMTPYAVVLDKKSVVSKVAVPLIHIKTELEGLMFSK